MKFTYFKKRGVPLAQSGKSSKFRAKATTVDGIRFHSKLEAEYYSHLKLLKASGEVKNFHRQLCVDLGGGVRHFVDFLILYEDGHEYVEVKGYDKPESRAKRLIAQDRLGVEITLVTSETMKAINGRGR